MIITRKYFCFMVIILLVVLLFFWLVALKSKNNYYFGNREQLVNRFLLTNYSQVTKELFGVDRKLTKKEDNVEMFNQMYKLLQNMNIKIDKLLSKNSNSSDKVHTVSVEGEVKQVRTDRNSYRKVMLQKLSAEHRALELLTDPLPLSAACPSKIFLTVLILSSPNNEGRRRDIRDSWAYAYNNDSKLIKNPKPLREGESISANNMFKAVFVIGKAKDELLRTKVLEEARTKKDIILGDLLEDYKNLTMKTRLGLKWLYYECDSLYMLKTDDDAFVNPVALVEWLKEKSRTNLYTGWCNSGARPIRRKTNKWYVSREDYNKTIYPKYCLGGAYLMSNDVLGKVMNLSYGRKLFPMEDLYVGLMIDELKEVKAQDERSHFDLIYGGRKSDCDFNNLFLAHRVVGNDLKEHIKRARNASINCK